MINIESQIYDAAMLTALAVFDTEMRVTDGTESYDPNNIITRNRAHNRALKRIVDGREPTGGAMTWQPDDMYLTFKALEEGRYVDISQPPHRIYPRLLELEHLRRPDLQ